MNRESKPSVIERMAPTSSVERRPIEGWAKAKQPELWRYRAAKALRDWPIGAEVTEAEFDEALKAAGEISLGYSHPTTEK